MTPRLSVVLPEGWHGLPLHPEAERHRAVDALAARSLGSGTGVTGLRQQVAGELRATADQAAGSGAQQLVLSLMRTPQGLPLPASLVVSVVDVGRPALAAALEMPGEGGLETARVPGGHVVRRVREVPAGSALVEAGTPTLAADYWLRADDRPHVGVLAFSSPLTALRDGLLPLFDAVVASARWHDPADPRTSRRT